MLTFSFGPSLNSLILDGIINEYAIRLWLIHNLFGAYFWSWERRNQYSLNSLYKVVGDIWKNIIFSFSLRSTMNGWLKDFLTPMISVYEQLAISYLCYLKLYGKNVVLHYELLQLNFLQNSIDWWLNISDDLFT